jgi:chromosome segregation ATPase
MSPHAANSLVHDLVQMAQAFERLPGVEAELNQANETIGHQANTIQRLELKLIDRNITIETLHTTVRDLEVARDDAELRFLEADDKINRILGVVRSATVTLEGAVGEDKRPEPETTTEPMPISPALHVEEQGQSAPNPIPALTEKDASIGSANETAMDSDTAFIEITQVEPLTGPYHNKLYIDVPGYIILPDWLAGGGTEADYYFRR